MLGLTAPARWCGELEPVARGVVAAFRPAADAAAMAGACAAVVATAAALALYVIFADTAPLDLSIAAAAGCARGSCLLLAYMGLPRGARHCSHLGFN